jgi:hypothetical protein
VRRYQFYGVMVAEWSDVIFCCEGCLGFRKSIFVKRDWVCSDECCVV